MKKIITVLITSALLIGCGLTDKGMDRKVNLDDGAAFVDVLSSAIDETTPEQGEIIRTYIPAIISGADFDYKTTLSKKSLNAIDGKSIKEVLINYFDSQIELASRSLAEKKKGNGVKFELMTIQPIWGTEVNAELNVENTTDWNIEGFSADGVTTVSGKHSKIIWDRISNQQTAIKPGGNVNVQIRGRLELAETETVLDLSNSKLESDYHFVNFWLKDGEVISNDEKSDLQTIETFKKYKAVILGNSESASEQSVATTEQKQSIPTADKSRSTSQQAQTPVKEQIYKYEPSTYNLKGALQSVAGETPDGEKVTFQAIKLEQPITVQGDGETPTEKSITVMQLVLDAETQQAFKSLEGQPVSITGTMFHADNSNHKTNVLMTASAISALAQ